LQKHPQFDEDEYVQSGFHPLGRQRAPKLCLRLIRALAAETHEEWLEANRYLNMDLLREHKKLTISLAA
jgi:hypothetical protein